HSGGKDLCDHSGRPKSLTLTYTGDGCDATSHGQAEGKVTCTGDPAEASPVKIVITNSSDPNNRSARKWFEGTVTVGQTLTMNARNGGESKLSSNSYAYVYANN